METRPLDSRRAAPQRVARGKILMLCGDTPRRSNAVRSSSPMMAVTDMPGISTETGSESPKEGNLAFKPSLPLY